METPPTGDTPAFLFFNKRVIKGVGLKYITLNSAELYKQSINI